MTHEIGWRNNGVLQPRWPPLNTRNPLDAAKISRSSVVISRRLSPYSIAVPPPPRYPH
jgi:hypothetical protein